VVIRRLLRRGGLRHRELAVGAVRARHELRVRPDLDNAPALQHLRPNMSDSRHCLPFPLESNGFRAGCTGIAAGGGANHDAIGLLDGREAVRDYERGALAPARRAALLHEAVESLLRQEV
jgi:hypothetical protein